MTFDFGEVLSRAAQITWKHKILWLFSALPTLLSFLFFPVMFMLIFFMEDGSFGQPSFLNDPAFAVFWIVLNIFIVLASYVLYGISSASVMFGTVRADDGAERLTLRELFNDSKKYWLRVLGVLLLIGLGISTIFLVVFGCMALTGAVTAGIGFVCLMPFYLLLYPVMIVLYGFIEESQAAVVVDDLGVVNSIKRGWGLVKANFWRILLISLIVYFGITILSSIVMMPLMMPFFFIPFFIENQQFEFTPQTMMLIMGAFAVLFIPIMALVQGITITFMKATYTLAYLRLTRSAKPNAELQEATA